MTDVYPIQVLREARSLVKSGAYAEAFDKYRWFYDNALVYERALCGVRNSYVLMEWADLGKVFPPARQELEIVRDEKVALLREGSSNAELFIDVSAINSVIGQVELTSAIYAEIAENEPEFAQKCFRAALPALVHTLDFTLARRFIKSPEDSLGAFAKILNRNIESGHSMDADSPITLQKALVHNYVKNVLHLLDVFVGVGDAAETRKFAVAAVELVSPSISRDEVREKLRPYLPEDGIGGNSE
jgi:hypothetical protein